MEDSGVVSRFTYIIHQPKWLDQFRVMFHTTWVKVHRFLFVQIPFLVAGFNPTEKNISQNGNLPQMFGENKNIWNHHLVVDSLTHLEIKNSKTDYI